MRLSLVIVSSLLGVVIGFWAELMLQLRMEHTYFLPLLIPPTLFPAIVVFMLDRKARKDKRLERELGVLPAEIRGMVKTIMMAMRYRRKVRGEVMAELAGHFEDALKECGSEEEREKKARELTEEFGDAKLLGVLCRRAKKRCRPLWRTIIMRWFQAVGILLVCLVIYVVWFMSGTPAISTNYIEEFNETVRPAADESLNAAPLYAEAVQRLAELSEEVSDAISKIGKDPNERDEEIVREWLTQNSEALALVDEGSQKPYFWVTYANPNNTTDMMGILLPNLSDYRTLANCLCWRAVLRAEDGEYDRALEDLTACFRFGMHIKGKNVLVIEQLVGIRIKEVSTEALRNILYQYGEQIEAATVSPLCRRFQGQPDGDNLAISYTGERFCLYDQIQRCFTEDRFGSGHLSIKELPRVLSYVVGRNEEDYFVENVLPRMTHILFTHPNKMETREKADEFYAFIEKCTRKTPFEMRTEQIEIQTAAQELTKGNILLEIMTPGFSRIIELGHRDRANGEATGAVIATILYEKEKGAFPDSLEELVEKGFLEGVPMDPYSDGALVYRKAGDGFTLYSVGENFDDDGGTAGRDRDGRPKLWGSSGDAVFWPVDKGESE